MRLAAADRRNSITAEILDAVTSADGKGYRPSLLLLAGRMGPDYKKVRQKLCRLGALVEYVHMASLVHDDIVDDSPTRRGVATVQARFGKDMAVFTGDLMLGQVMRVLLEENDRKSGLLIANTVRDMCAGEISQADCLFRCDTSVEQYYNNVFGKTVSIFVTSCKIGAMESGLDRGTIDLLGIIGLHLGFLFQIRDDLMDFLPDNGKEGKPVGQDFREGILTLPVLYALEDPRCRGDIEKLVCLAKQGTFTAKEAKELEALLVKGNGFAAAIADAENRQKSICELLDRLEKSAARDMLKELVQSLSLPKLP